MSKYLVLGGAGFIGSHLVDSLVAKGCDVTIFDSLEPQVHPNGLPDYINTKAEFIQGDIRNKKQLLNAIKGKDYIFHQAAAVGVGQSMYEIKKYIDVNTLGTANLLDLIINENIKIKKIVVASSMSIYGEGSYRCDDCDCVSDTMRIGNLENWEPSCDNCGRQLQAVATNEEKLLKPSSVYAISKKDQEDLCLCIGKAYGIPTVALRYFNVYGTRQSLSNPYTGVIAIFASRLLNNNRPLIFEDGMQTRDFTNVLDIVNANILAMENESLNYGAYNVGTGISTSLRTIAALLGKYLNENIQPQVLNKARKGDIRHCFADISKIRNLGYSPQITLEEGLKQLCEWMKGENSQDNVQLAALELERKGLIV